MAHSTYRTMLDVLDKQASTQPDGVACHFYGFNGEVIASYTELREQAIRIAACLQEQEGYSPGERVMLLMEPGVPYIAAFWGCLYAGLVAVPAYPPLRQRHMKRLQAIIDDAQARFILTSDMISQLANFEGSPLVVEAFLSRTDGVYVPYEPEGSTLAFLQYTSGSTGHPKGVMVTHANLLNNLHSLQQLYGLPEEKVCSWLPPYHDMGLIGGILYPIFVGAPVFLFPPIFFIKDPLLWLRTISEQRITTSCAPNFAYTLCADTVRPEELAALDLSCWKISLNGAEPIRAETLDRFAAVFSTVGYSPDTLCPAYGMAETTLILSGKKALEPNKYLDVNKEALEQHQVKEDGSDQSVRLVSCGPVIPEHQVCIVNPETRRLCGSHEVGEIWVQGPSITRGYWGREALTQDTYQATLLEQPESTFFRTGDLGFLDHEQNLYITGRWKDLLIVKGRNLHPHDLEDSVSMCHPDLLRGQCAVFQHDAEGEGIVAVQEVSPTAEDTSSIFAAIQNAVVDDHEVRLQHIVLIERRSLPKTSSGKIQRKRCRDLFLSDELKVVAHKEFQEAVVPPDVELFSNRPQSSEMLFQSLRASLATLTGTTVAAVEPNVPFASFGLDSTRAVQYCAQLSSWLELDVPPATLWQHPNLLELSRHLAVRLGLQSVSHFPDVSFDASLSEPVAIVGMACRLPGAIRSAEQLWEALLSGKDCVNVVSSERWGSSEEERTGAHFGGFLDDVDQFDAPFFQVTPREAAVLDPQQRIALEVSWEALEHAGVNTDDWSHRYAGVFVGVDNSDYRSLLQLYGGEERLNPFAGTGNALSAVAGRISYFLGWQGPAISVNTACSSSLVATHQAVASLQQGECDLALAGGCNLLLDPVTSQMLERAGMLSPDGRCKTFDASANGYVRAEGCVFLVLRRLSDAQRENDTIYAVIRGSAVNQDGRSNGFTAPHGGAQAQLYRSALSRAGIEPSEVSLVEAHGTGTVLGDAIELQSLYDVYGQDRDSGCPLHLGAIKTNMGHLESAAGVTGLMKAALCLHHEAIPQNLHLSQPNAMLDTMSGVFHLPSQTVPWSRKKQPRLAAVSSFGFTGTNAHLIVEEAPPYVSEPSSFAYPHLLLPLSASSEQALEQALEQAASCFQTGTSIGTDLAYTLSVGRTPLSHRAVCLSGSEEDMHRKLREREVQRSQGASSSPRVAFLFTGQGSQYPGMCRELVKHPVFREALESCLQLALEPLQQRLRGLLLADSPDEDTQRLLQQTEYTQPALFALEYSLATLWQSWGIQPDVVMGHSVGEYVAAVLAGVLSYKDGFQLVVERGRLMQQLQDPGCMVAVNVPSEAAAELVHTIEGLDVAAVNGPHQVVLSGRDDAVEQAIKQVRGDGKKAHRLAVSHGFHSCMMEPMLQAFHDAAHKVQFHKPSLPWITNVTGAEATDVDASYWVKQIRQPVQFYKGVQCLERRNIAAYVEVGPQPILLALGKRSVSNDSKQRAYWLPSMEKGKDPWEQMLSSLGSLYVRGTSVDWRGYFQPCPQRKVAAPTYPFQRQRYWFTASPKSQSSGMFVPSLQTAEAHGEVESATPKGVLFDSGLPAPQAFQATLEHWLLRLSGLEPEHLDLSASFQSIGLTSLHLMELWYELFLCFPSLADYQGQLVLATSPAELMQRVCETGVSTEAASSLPPTDSPVEHEPKEEREHFSASERSVLASLQQDNQGKTWSATLSVDQSHPFFFDHPYDHVPGVLFVEGISQLVEASFANRSPEQSYALTSLSLVFEAWGELEGALVVTMEEGDKVLRGQVLDSNVTPPLSCVTFQATYAALLPQQERWTRQAEQPRMERRLVHKENTENVVVGPLRQTSQGQYRCSLSELPSSHTLMQGPSAGLSMTHLLEASRQCMTAMAHSQGEPMDRVFVLLSSSIELSEPIRKGSPVELRAWPLTTTKVGERFLAKLKLQVYVEEKEVGHVQILGNTVTQEAYQTQRWGRGFQDGET
ncbi:MAG: acyltransferase domain-containing protein [Deltaproteobacteria bacterium]|nr:MAG: acyltransferase domain-containing protein [Deltaproteobacteria bacterium]